VDPKAQWAIAEETAAKHGKTMDRAEWRLVTPLHVAPTRKEAIADIKAGALEFLTKYWEDALGNGRSSLPRPSDQDSMVEQLIETGQWIVGSPDDCAASIERLQEITGGFGGLMFRAQEHAAPEKVRQSYEMFARYVAPRFQGSLESLDQSYNRVVANVAETRKQSEAAINRAHQVYEQGQSKR
jgi:limonene 1,2-monooxygenase